MTFIDELPPSEIAAEMEAASTRWHERYPLPIMVFAERQSRKPVGLQELKNADCLTSVSEGFGKPLRHHWGTLPDAAFPAKNYSNGHLIRMYHDIPMRSSTRARRDADVMLSQIRMFKWGLILVTIIVPVAFSIYVEFLSPRWVAIALFAYGLYKSGRELLVRLGKINKTEKQKKEEEKRLKERHYYYHCELNPDGFLKLKIENFQNDSDEYEVARERQLRETKFSENGRTEQYVEPVI